MVSSELVNVVIERRQLMRLMQLLVLCALALAAPAWSGSKKAPPRYPSELHGFWIPEAAGCPKAGESFIGDTALQIGPRLIQAYEDLSKATSAVLISRTPLAWRIESLTDAGPSSVYTKDQPSIYVVGEQRITIVSFSNAETYRKCADQHKQKSQTRRKAWKGICPSTVCCSSVRQIGTTASGWPGNMPSVRAVK